MSESTPQSPDQRDKWRHPLYGSSRIFGLSALERLREQMMNEHHSEVDQQPTLPASNEEGLSFTIREGYGMPDSYRLDGQLYGPTQLGLVTLLMLAKVNTKLDRFLSGTSAPETSDARDAARYRIVRVSRLTGDVLAHQLDATCDALIAARSSENGSE